MRTIKHVLFAWETILSSMVFAFQGRYQIAWFTIKMGARYVETIIMLIKIWHVQELFKTASSQILIQEDASSVKKPSQITNRSV